MQVGVVTQDLVFYIPNTGGDLIVIMYLCISILVMLRISNNHLIQHIKIVLMVQKEIYWYILLVKHHEKNLVVQGKGQRKKRKGEGGDGEGDDDIQGSWKSPRKKLR